MLTYNRNFSRNPESIPQEFTKEVMNEDGSSTILTSDKPFESPYDGLDCRSFTIEAKIKAGVPLKPISPHSMSGNISGIDKATALVEEASKAK